MSSFESAILVVLVQATLFALMAAIVYALVQGATRRSQTGLLFLSLTILIAIWLVAVLPLPAWWSVSSDSVAEWTRMPGNREITARSVIHDAPVLPAESSSAKCAVEPYVDRTGLANQVLDIDQMLPTGANLPIATNEGGNLPAGQRQAVGPSVVILFRAVAWLSLFAVAVGLGRFSLGLISIVLLKRQLTTIGARRLVRLVAQLQQRLDCGTTLRLAEHKYLTTAATVGWTEPTLILPVDWHTWSDEKLSAVCAHEIAHIRNRDYLANLVAQFSAAVNFYNPVVHWLAAQFRLAQEVEADQTAASMVGGSESYLKILAELALDEDVKPVGWLAPSFLPTQRMLLRRVQMLKLTNRRQRGNRRYGSITASLVLVVVAILLLGVRLTHLDPAITQSTLGQNSSPEGTTSPSRIESADDLVPQSANMFFVVRPAEFLASDHLQNGSADPVFADQLKQLTESIHQTTRLNCGLSAEKVETVTFFLNSDERGSAVFVLRSNEPRPAGFDDEYELSSTHRDVRYGRFTGQKRMYSWVAPLDEKTVAVSFSAEGIQAAIDAWRGDRAAWTELASDFAGHQFYFGLNREFIQQRWTVDDYWLTQSVSVLWEKVVNAAGSIELSPDGMKARIIADCGTPAEATRVAETGQAAAVLTRNFIDRSAEQVPRADRERFVPFRDLFEQAFQSLEVSHDGDIAQAEFSIDERQNNSLAELLVWTVTARMAAERVQAMNKLRMVAIAMHNYHDAHKSLPPAIITSKDGRHRHSWRIALLPFLDQGPQYNAYRFDEPWNSPHNSEVTANMPEVYSNSFQAGPRTPTIVLVTGKGCVFDGQKKTKLQQISDGTSNTILLVEADLSGQQHRHWADPDANIRFDLFDEDQKKFIASEKDFREILLAKLGDGSPEGFKTAFCDGSAQYIGKDEPLSLLMNLFAVNDGGVIVRGDLK